jgi:formate hydrogenlyase subunit 6/NADH:ubiquinone oxidoreductase subunit I
MNKDDNWLPQINPLHCIGCGDCIAQCPSGALGWDSKKASLVHPGRCTYCATCEDLCPKSAIEVPYLITKTEKRGANQ